MINAISLWNDDDNEQNIYRNASHIKKLLGYRKKWSWRDLKQ